MQNRPDQAAPPAKARILTTCRNQSRTQRSPQKAAAQHAPRGMPAAAAAGPPPVRPRSTSRRPHRWPAATAVPACRWAAGCPPAPPRFESLTSNLKSSRSRLQKAGLARAARGGGEHVNCGDEPEAAHDKLLLHTRADFGATDTRRLARLQEGGHLDALVPKAKAQQRLQNTRATSQQWQRW